MDEKWYDDIEEKEEMDTGVTEYDITSTPNDFNISTIFSLVDNGVIKLPPFQRNYVWDEKRASKLIESIILGLPIPQVFLYEQGKNSFYIIDGQQRLLSIYFFMKQRFPTKEGKSVLRQYLTGDTKIDNCILSNDSFFKNFSLKLPTAAGGEKNKLDKLKYETLGDYKYTFDILRTIRSVVIKQNEPKDDSSIYEIFNRLNTGGQNLSQQEIRMSLYYSDFYKKLFELNGNNIWRQLLCQSEQDINFKDIEILLRSFAMLFNYSIYSAPMGKFLNTFSKQADTFSADAIEYLERLFESFLNACSSLEKGIFCSNNNKFSISLFESVFVATCKEFFENKQLIADQKISNDSIIELKRNDDFSAASQGSVASKQNLTTRIQKAFEIIKFL